MLRRYPAGWSAIQAVAWLLADPAADPDLGPGAADELARDPGPALGPVAESAPGAASVPSAA
jgi:hypothetical protein